MRGCEYLSSAPKYNLLYERSGWEVPTYVHLPLIMGKNEDGSVSKLSKRHGATSFEDLMQDGYLPEAITNYIALLAGAPRIIRRCLPSGNWRKTSPLTASANLQLCLITIS